MKHAKILDCTLRDGAYLLDKRFGSKTIHGIIDGLCKAKVDIIEMGFLQDEGMGEGKTVFRTSKEAEQYIPKEKGNTLFAVLADYSRYSVDNLDSYTGRSIDIVRVCFFKKERYDVIDFCRKVKEKGFMLFVQPVDILGYTDAEVLELIEAINLVEPYCFSIVDTFGSMYSDDLKRVFSLLDHNLYFGCKMGFHSHNNMQMSNALSQEFLQLSYGKREVVVDTTISGMGRGAGNTPTELVMQYMVYKMGYHYDIDIILDVIDTYMDNIRSRCTWGYNTPYFIAGCYSAHVNNIIYLTQKPTIRSRDIRFILNKMDGNVRKKYDYDLLESTYLDYMESEIDDTEFFYELQKIFVGKEILVLAPGNSIKENESQIKDWVNSHEAIVVAVNFLHDSIPVDYLFMSNTRRYEYWKLDKRFSECKRIVTSNVIRESKGEYVISFMRLIKCGWENMDNATILLLRLLDMLDVKAIVIAGFDGYDSGQNYLSQDMELLNPREFYGVRNKEIQAMLEDYAGTRKLEVPISFLTETRFHF